MIGILLAVLVAAVSDGECTGDRGENVTELPLGHSGGVALSARVFSSNVNFPLLLVELIATAGERSRTHCLVNGGVGTAYLVNRKGRVVLTMASKSYEGTTDLVEVTTYAIDAAKLGVRVVSTVKRDRWKDAEKRYNEAMRGTSDFELELARDAYLQMLGDVRYPSEELINEVRTRSDQRLNELRATPRRQRSQTQLSGFPDDTRDF